MSAGLWPWLAVAAAGALHGLNPGTGWGLATLCGRGDARRSLRTLAPLAAGHAVSVALVAGLVALVGVLPRGPMLVAAGVVLAAAVALCWRGHRTRQAGVALWSFGMATAHGAGLMLVPALVPLCLSASPAREITASGSLMLALAAVAVHLAALLATTAVATWLVCTGASRWRATMPAP